MSTRKRRFITYAILLQKSVLNRQCRSTLSFCVYLRSNKCDEGLFFLHKTTGKLTFLKSLKLALFTSMFISQRSSSGSCCHTAVYLAVLPSLVLSVTFDSYVVYGRFDGQKKQFEDITLGSEKLYISPFIDT